MSLDLAFKLNPVVGLKVGAYSVDQGATTAEDAFLGFGAGLRYGPAFYFRYQPLLVGVQYNIGNMNSALLTTRDNSYSDKGNFSAFNFILGFKF
jgi:hypothetical protein